MAASYRTKKLKNIASFSVKKVKDFLEKGYIDEDEDELPQENFLMLELENGFTVAIRPSGTEPKIKYYLFGSGEKNTIDLEKSKEEVSAKMKEISEWLLKDAKERVN